MKLSNREH